VDIRILATSNRDLAQAVKDGTFREDLLYRLNVVNLRLPPLRERPGDVLALADHFVKKYAAANGVPVRPLSAEAKRALAAHRWPGNVRELENAMHRAVLLASGPRSTPRPSACRTASRLSVAGSRRVAPPRRRPWPPTPCPRLRRPDRGQMEQTLIIDTLEHCLGNRTHAANILGISIRTLRNKLKEYADAGVSVPPPQRAERGLR
jgi:two-component system response regulator FlrC